MKQAKEYALANIPDIEISLFSAQYQEDLEQVPPYFIKTPNLERSVLDSSHFDIPRKLPLIADLLQKMYDNSDAEYLIYTNVDIIVLPYFYTAVFSFIQQGYDAFIINRRRISDRYKNVSDLPLIYAALGKPHPGFDCFVFHRSLFTSFRLANICIGIPFIEIALAHNLFCFSKKFHLFHDQHLTVHLGMEVIKDWGDKQYVEYNKKQFLEIKNYLMPHFNIRKFPYSHLPIHKRYLSWLFNPAMQIDICQKVETSELKKLFRYHFNEFFFRFIWGWR